MIGGIIKASGITVIICIFISCSVVSDLPPGFCLPANDTVALGVFAPSGSPSGEEQIVIDEISAFRESTGKNPAIVVFSDEWMNDKKFPLAGVTTIRSEGKVPYVRLMMRSTDKPYQQEPLYTLNNIILGKFDGELRAWAREARAFGSPVLIEYGTEVNQWSYPWNGYWNGYASGQETFKEAFRHIKTLMEEEGASNLIWAYHLNAESLPDETWNNMTSYYPGDEYCDIITVSLYGSKKPFETGEKDFTVMMNSVNNNLALNSIHKPILVITGTDIRNMVVNPASWVEKAVTSLSDNAWPDVKGLIWYNAAWKNDNNPLHDSSMRLEDNSAVGDAFKSVLQKINVKEQLSC